MIERSWFGIRATKVDRFYKLVIVYMLMFVKNQKLNFKCKDQGLGGSRITKFQVETKEGYV